MVRLPLPIQPEQLWFPKSFQGKHKSLHDTSAHTHLAPTVCQALSKEDPQLLPLWAFCPRPHGVMQLEMKVKNPACSTVTHHTFSRAQRPQSSGHFPSHTDQREAELAVLGWGLNPPSLHGESPACKVLATQTYTLRVLPPQFNTHPGNLAQLELAPFLPCYLPPSPL